MGTALAVTQQQSIEATGRGWTKTHSSDRCPRCNGLMVAEGCEDVSDHTAHRCVQCGEIIDPVILQNRQQVGLTSGQGQRWESAPHDNYVVRR